MSEIKKTLKKIPVVYFLWHKIRLSMNKRKETKKKLAYQKYGMDVLKDIFDIAKKNKFNLICAYGTLLGVVRDNQLLSWDDDMDFIMLDNGKFNWKKFDECMKSGGFCLYRAIEQDGKVVEISYKKKNVLCDVRIWDNYGVERNVYGEYFPIDNYMYNYKGWEEYDMTVQKMIPINNIINIDFHGIEIAIPDNSEKVLEKLYGKDWRIPDLNYVPQGKKIRVKRMITYY